MTTNFGSITQTAESTPFDNSTNGFLATDVQAAIEESVHSSNAFEVTATANDTTSSGTDAVMAGMTITPVAGTYLVWFSGAITSASANATVTTSLYGGATRKADSERILNPFDGGTLSATSSTVGVAMQGLITVNGSQAITAQWKRSAGTATVGARNLSILRVA